MVICRVKRTSARNKTTGSRPFPNRSAALITFAPEAPLWNTPRLLGRVELELSVARFILLPIHFFGFVVKRPYRAV
jgi:hypothetical protein